jgi:hypothetical protein
MRLSSLIVSRLSTSKCLQNHNNLLSGKGDDSAATNFNPQPVKTTIEFRGLQVSGALLLDIFKERRSSIALGNLHLPSWRNDSVVVREA